MSMASDAAPLDIGKVIGDLFKVLGRNLVTFLVASAILTGLPALLIGYIQLGTLEAGAAAGLSRLPWTLLAALVGLVAGLVLQGALIYATVTDMNGKRPSIADALTVGLRKFLPLFAIGILVGLAVLAGIILLVVPGIMIAIAWSVAVPTYVAERLDVMDVFGRSAELTRGNRWRIFGLGLILFVVSLVVQLVVVGVTTGAMFAAPHGALVLRSLIVQPILQVITQMIGATGVAVLYVELRRVREGVGSEAIAAVFD